MWAQRPGSPSSDSLLCGFGEAPTLARRRDVMDRYADTWLPQATRICSPCPQHPFRRSPLFGGAASRLPVSRLNEEIDTPIRCADRARHPGGPHQRQDHEGDRTQTQLCSSASRSFEAMQWISDCIFCFWSPPSAVWEEETHALGAVKGGARVCP